MGLDRRGFLSLAAASFAALRLRRARAETHLRAMHAAQPGPLARAVHRDTWNTLAGAIGRTLWPPGGSFSVAKPYPGRPRVELPGPPPRSERGDGPLLHEHVGAANDASESDRRALAGGPLSLATLARLLHLTNGVTQPGNPALRAAPSAGALYAGEVYVVAARVEGLQPGVYSYHVPSHELVRLAADEDALKQWPKAVEAPWTIAEAPLVVLLTNVFGRYAQRYANRGYRYALIDSGHIGENLRVAASASGLSVRSPRRFHDAALNALLGIDGRGEAVCALHALGQPTQAPADAAAQQRVTLMQARHAPDFRVDSDASTPERYHAATSLMPGAPRATPLPESWPAVDPAGDGIALPRREPPRAGISWGIRERRSARRFEPTPVALADLAWLLELARGDRAEASGIALRVVAHRIAGLPPGIYHHHAGPTRLVPLRSGDQRKALHRVCLRQDKAQTAAAGVALLADLSLTGGGRDRVYRDLLREAGAMAQRLYLGAEALGLAARNLAAFFDDDLNELLDVDGETRAVVHLTMLGAGN